MKTVFAIGIVIGILACNNNSQSKTVVEVEQQKPVEKQEVKEFKIREVATVAENWSELIAFEKELRNYLSKAVKSENEMDLLFSLLDDIEKTVPEDYNEPSVLSRIKVLKTELYASKQLLFEKQFSKLSEKKASLQAVYNTLVNQIETTIIKKRDYENYN